MTTDVIETLNGIKLNSTAYVELLRQLISVSEQVQNAPALDLIPQEDLVSDFVLAALDPHLKQNGGPIIAERVTFIEGRGNLILQYVGTSDSETLAFVGSHMDVVPANPETWERNPFELSVEGDHLYGRGTTDCLGHVALMTQLFIELAVAKVKTKRTIVAILIASEENTEIPDVGVDKLMSSGKMDFIKNGPVIWVDCADSQPCMGTAGVVTWTLEAKGKLFHSGLPHQGINAMEMGMDALKKVQERFYADFPQHDKEKEYNFVCSSTMKPTTIEGSVNGMNQIPPWVKISGDVRLAPFYSMDDLQIKLKSYVDDINADITQLEGGRGPHSKYNLPDEMGTIELTFGGHYMEGIACSSGSLGNRALLNATKDVKGQCTPYSIMGSLPLVKDLQRAGFDIQLAGFGLSSVYHGDNEYCTLTGMQEAIQILSRVIAYAEME